MEELELNDLEPITLNFSNNNSGFDNGLELLMNQKTKNSSSSTKIDLGELDKLEEELNDLSASTQEPSQSSGGNTRAISGFSNLFGFGSSSKQESVKINVEEESDSKLGHATKESIGNTRTWDGFSKINEVPQESTYRASSNLSEREKRRKKRAMIKKLEEWSNKGSIQYTSNYNMDSNYEEVEDEYEGAIEEKRKRDAVKIQKDWLISMVNTIEYGNSYFDPFGVNLDGWGEAVSEDIDTYSEIFEQLHDKYKGGKMSPELSLLLRLGFSASVIHFTNKALSTATPGFNDVIKQSPELMRMFTNATVDSMKQTAPGMSFASELLNQSKPTTMNGPPPPPVESRSQAPPPASSRPGMQFTQMPGNRPDLNAGRGGGMFQERGVEINSRGANVSQPESMLPPIQTTRPEMTGPKNTNIDNILAGLKTKHVDIQQPTEDDSMISVSSLRDMQNMNLPKRSRKNRSDKNIVSLDL
jgi:hypothetical protein